jgi:hypothetical protein
MYDRINVASLRKLEIRAWPRREALQNVAITLPIDWLHPADPNSMAMIMSMFSCW